MNKAILRPLKIKATGQVIPAGTVFSLTVEKHPESGNVGLRCVNADLNLNIWTRKFSVFFKAPSIATLEKWSNDGICKTPTGHKVEPDGHGPDGVPSWLLLMGMI